MTALITELAVRGITLSARGDRLHYEGPVSAADLAMLKASKAELLHLLRTATEPPPPVPADAIGPLALCPVCAWPHFWLADTGWCCDRSPPRPVPFHGPSVTVPSAAPIEPLAPVAQRQPLDAEAAELRALIERVYAGDTEADRAEALAFALADPDGALLAYRAIAAERGPALGPGPAANQGKARTAAARVRCADCRHFQRIDHPHLGHCAQGQPEATCGLWDDDERHCVEFRRPPC